MKKLWNEMKKKDLGILITEGTIYLDCWMTGKQIKKIIILLDFQLLYIDL